MSEETDMVINQIITIFEESDLSKIEINNILNYLKKLILSNKIKRR